MHMSLKSLSSCSWMLKDTYQLNSCMDVNISNTVVHSFDMLFWRKHTTLMDCPSENSSSPCGIISCLRKLTVHMDNTVAHSNWYVTLFKIFTLMVRHCISKVDLVQMKFHANGNLPHLWYFILVMQCSSKGGVDKFRKHVWNVNIGISLAYAQTRTHSTAPDVLHHQHAERRVWSKLQHCNFMGYIHGRVAGVQ